MHLDRYRLRLQGIQGAAVYDGKGHGLRIMPVLRAGSRLWAHAVSRE